MNSTENSLLRVTNLVVGEVFADEAIEKGAQDVLLEVPPVHCATLLVGYFLDGGVEFFSLFCIRYILISVITFSAAKASILCEMRKEAKMFWRQYDCRF